MGSSLAKGGKQKDNRVHFSIDCMVKDFKAMKKRLETGNVRGASPGKLDGRGVEWRMALHLVGNNCQVFIYPDKASLPFVRKVKLRFYAQKEGGTYMSLGSGVWSQSRGVGFGPLPFFRKLEQMVFSDGSLPLRCDLSYKSLSANKPQMGVPLDGLDALHDFEILVSDHSSIPCHRFLLAVHSPVIKAIFTRPDFKETQQRLLVIQDFDPPAVRAAIEFLYKSQLPADKDLYPELLLFADKYDIAAIKAAVVPVLVSELKADNVLDLLALGDRANSDELKSRAMDLFRTEKSLGSVPEASFHHLITQQPQLAVQLLHHADSVKLRRPT